MAITITKTKPKAESLPKADIAGEEVAVKAVADLSLEELADRYGSLEDQVSAANMNPVFALFDEVKKELAKRLKTEMEPEDSGELSGEHWALEIGAAAKNPRVIKSGAIPVVQGFLGTEVFCQVAKVGLADLDKYLTPDQLSSVVETDTGYSDKRKITCAFKG